MAATLCLSCIIMTISEYIDQGGSFLQGLHLLRAAGDHRTADRLQVYTTRAFVPPSARTELMEALRYCIDHATDISIAPPLEDIEPKLDDIYGQLRAWDQEGVRPVADRRRIVQETVEKMNRRETVRSRIYRLRKWLDGGKKLTDQKRRDYEVELKDKELELRELEENLGLA